MVEKIGPIKNPLTVIALFAGLAEVSGTTVLPFVAPGIQHIYIWFLMAFPALLISLFFVTLLWKHHVLYAPADFRSDESFTGLLVAVSGVTRFAKLEQEVREVEAAEAQVASAEAPAASTDVPELPKIVRRDIRASALLAEELVLATLGKEYGQRFERNVAFAAAPDLLLDGVVSLPGRTAVVEVKYSRTGILGSQQADAAFGRLLRLYQRLPARIQQELEVIFAVVTEGEARRRHGAIRASIARVAEGFPFKTSIRLFDFDSLDSQIGREFSSDDEASSESFKKRIVGILGAGRPLTLREIMQRLDVTPGDRTVASVQAAIGALVMSGQIENNPSAVEEYKLRKSS